MTLQGFKTKFELHLKKELIRRKNRFSQTTKDQFLESIVEQAVAITLNGGKRLRPYLVDLMFRTARGHTTSALIQAQLGVELFHTALLIHDDVMDRGTKRHHLDTVHSFVSDQLHKNGRDTDDAIHVGFSQAISIGDLFLSWASDLIHETNNNRVWEIWQTSFGDVVAGQLLDIDGTTRQAVDNEFITRKMDLKTASYSVIGPLKIGRALAANRKSLDSFIESFGYNIGLAYQIQDDLFDWTGGTGDSSKKSVSDIETKQQTIVRNWIMSHGTNFHRTTLKKLEEGSHIDGQSAHTLAQDSGAIKAITVEMNRLFDLAQAKLDKQKFTPDIKKEWQALLDTIKNRNN